MTIDPRWSFWLSMTLAVLGFLAGAGGSYADLGLSEHAVKGILGLTTLCLGIGNAVNAVLAAIPSKSGEPSKFYLGPKPTEPTPSAQKQP